MKILQNAVLALLLTGSMLTVRADEAVVASLQNVLMVLEGDTQLYSRLQEELDEVAKEFDASAEMRRHLQCCVRYKVDSLYENYTHRENELLAIIAEKDQTIADLEERFEILKAEVGAEMEALATMVEVLTLELNSYRSADAFKDRDSIADVGQLAAQVQDLYSAMSEQRTNFLNKLGALANKVYGHFEVEAIESTVFGEQICGILYCPDLDGEAIAVQEPVAVVQEVEVSAQEAVSAETD